MLGFSQRYSKPGLQYRRQNRFLIIFHPTNCCGNTNNWYMARLFLLFMAVLAACNGQDRATGTAAKTTVAATDGYRWTKLFDSAAWPKNYNFQMFSLRDTLWTFHSEGCWFTADGRQWTKSPLPNVIQNHAFLDYVLFNNAIWGLGRLTGNIERFQFTPAIYRTANGTGWDTLATQSNLPPRFFYHPFVHDNKIWIIGGEDATRQYADVWNSADGVHWAKQKDSLPFGKRGNSQVVTLNGRLYLLDHDVWSSADGLDWRQETDAIVKGQQLFGYKAIVFDGQIWLLGCNRSGEFSSQVLHSADGKNWQAQQAPWLPRGGIAAAVFSNKIYMTGGKYGGTPQHTTFRYDNDLWVMERGR
jgi:hypothetical protein